MSTVPPGPGQPEKSSAVKITCIIVAAVMLCGGLPVVGILAAIAIPNFLKFQCKSKQSEAKVHLSGLFTAQKAFYGEYGTYTSDLVTLAWSPDGQPAYLYGFYVPGPEEDPENMPDDYDPERSDTANPDVLSAFSGGYSTAKMVTLTGRPLEAEDLPEQSVVYADAFLAAAVGDVDTDSYEQLDIWVIDDTRNLQVLSNDCTQ